MRTTSVKSADIKKKWYVVDASDKPLGRLASEIAYFLRGKHKPSFTPHLDCGDNIIVVNANKVKLTGSKWDKKIYYHHSGYAGGLKAIMASDLLQEHPERILQHAVKGMLPKNTLARKVLKNLKIYAGGGHPHVAQKPVPMISRLVKEGEQ